jgi:hypothetical protein
VDDLKLSHVDENKVTKAIDWLKSIYGKDMHVSRGKKQDYLGMGLDYSVPGEFKVSMIDYFKRIIDELSELIMGTSVSLDVDRLFAVRPDEERTLVGEKQDIAFHHCVAQ